MPARRTSGFTLIELMISVTVLIILLSISVPSFTSVFTRMRVEGVANELAADLQYARSESIRLRLDVSLTPDADGLGYQLLNAGTALKAVRFATGLQISTGTAVTFSQLRGMSNAVSLDLWATGAALRIVTNAMGRVLMCSPDQTISGYSAC